MEFRAAVLRILHRIFPFPLRGDARLADSPPERTVSCIINFYDRTHLLGRVLSSLAEQTVEPHTMEVILVEDRMGTEEGKAMARRFGEVLELRYHRLEDNFGILGYARNYALSLARGRYVLLLDDDTVILQRDFVRRLVAEFESTGADAVIPHGTASFCVLRDRYQYHDPFYPTSRCMAYRREVLAELGGFVSSMTGQEDVEVTVRFIASGRRAVRCRALEYLHPPFVVDNLRKPRAVGSSFASLRGRYPLPVWLMLLLNGMRHLPLAALWFNTRCRMLGRYSLGFALGILDYAMGAESNYG